jgi:hypothetical protein
MKRNKLLIGFLAVSITALSTLQSCKKKDTPTNTPPTTNTSSKVLVIDNGAQSVEMGKSSKYTATLVDVSGTTSIASGVTWSTNNTAVATFSADGTLSSAGIGTATITASVKVDGVTLTATAPIGIYTPSVFVVAPAAILWSKSGGPIQLEPVYFGNGSTTYSYTSSNSSIASVTSGGSVSCLAVGTCNITVTAEGLDGKPSITVPVMVVAEPEVKLPVVRVDVSPDAKDIFRGDHLQFSAKAYDPDNKEVSKTFTWRVADQSIATISASGDLTAVAIGQTTVYGTADGISGQAEVIVNPDTVILVEPFYATVGAGSTQQFVAKTYKINRQTGSLNLIGNLPGLKWEMPSYGLSIFDIGTVDANGLVSVKSGALPGLIGVLLAYIPNVTTIDPGVASVVVGIASNCNCGSENSSVHHISVSPSTVNISLTSGNVTQQLTAKAEDASNTEVTGAALVYCSDNEAAATVNSTGEITGTGVGTAHIKVCVGSKSTSVTVNVTF